VKAQVWDHLLYRHWDHYVGLKRSHVLVVSALDGNAVRDLTPRREIGDAEAPTFSLGGPLGYCWAPGSEEIAFVTNPDLVPAASTNNDVFTLLLDDAGARPRKISTSLGSDDGPVYSPDGKYIAFRSQARAGYESDRFRLMVFDRFSQTKKEMMPRFDRWVDELAWGRDSKTIYFTSGESGEENILSVGLEGGEPDHVATGAEYGELQVSPDGKRIVATSMTVRRPAEVVAVSPGGRTSGGAAHEGGITAVTHLNDGVVAGLELPLMDSFEFTGAVNTKVQGFVIRPPGFNEGRKYPVKFLIHGGPQGAWGDAWSYRWNPELMAASGYVVVMVNPRGSTGYGQAFIDGVNGDWGGKAYVDLMKGLDYAEQHYPFIDKTRECALGASYGGYMADWILTHTDRFACIVTHDGMFNPQSAYGTTEELWFNEWEFRRPAGAAKSAGAKGRVTAADDGPGQPWRYASGPIADDPFRKWSPMLSIQNAKTPTLVIHSQRDYRLDVSEGMQLFTALQRLNVPSRMLYFPDEGHWVLKPQNSRLWYEEVGAWCDRWTKSTGYVAAEVPVSAAPVMAAPVAAAPVRPVESVAKVSAPVRVPEAVAASVSAVASAPSVARSADAVVPSASAGMQAGGSAQAAVAGVAFSIAISVPEGEAKVGQDVPVTIAMTNVSDHQVLLPHKPGRENGEFSYEVEVKDEAGRLVPETAYGRESGDAAKRRAEALTVDYLQPGGTAVQVVHLGKMVGLKAGRYTVQVSRKDSLIDVVVRSNAVAVSVR
jgi:dipeptidyl aminopeptidase/acylaminoacyl peptidase